MGLPGVKINVLNGQLGRTPGSADGVAGLIGSGVADTGIALGEAIPPTAPTFTAISRTSIKKQAKALSCG
jgi:hypothetical protein